MKKILYTLLFFPLLVLGQSQDKNYVKTKTYLKPTTTSALTADDTLVSVTYVDGLGRPIQSVAVKAGGQKQDILTPIVYDAYGRQSKSYLPYSDPTQLIASLDYRKNDSLIGNINTYYQAKFPGELSSIKPNPYSETIYEESPLNRVVEQAAPGLAWRNSVQDDHTIKFEYGLNTANIYKFYVYFPDSTDTEKPKLGVAGYYGSRQLTKLITKDENWVTADGNNRTTTEYKDMEGRVVLKRTYNNNQKHDTYYVYDDYSNLTYVIPPLATDQIVYGPVSYPLAGYNYPWTLLAYVDQLLAMEYDQELEDYDNSEILNADLFDKFGGQGGFNISKDNNGGITLSLNITTSQPMPYRTGIIADLSAMGEFQDKEQGHIKGAGYEYYFLIRDNKLEVTGQGDVPSMAVTLTGQAPLEYSKNYPWTKFCNVNPTVAFNYEKDIELLDNDQILTTYTANSYGAMGGISISLDDDDALTVSLNFTANDTLQLAQGAVFPLDVQRSIADRNLGTVSGEGYNYEFKIVNNNFYIAGSGPVAHLSLYAYQFPSPEYAINEEAEALCYIYHYDYRNRVVEKHVPDNGWTYIVYDKLDRVVLTQDQNLRAKTTLNWLFTKYDKLGRAVYNGQYTYNGQYNSGTPCTDSCARKGIQSHLNNAVNPVLFEERTSASFPTGTKAVYYTHNAFPTDITKFAVDVINYYDNTTNINTDGLIYPTATYFGETLTANTKGLPVATNVKLSGATGWITTIMGYDTKGRIIFSREKNDLTTTQNVFETKLNFSGAPEETRNTIRKNNFTTMVIKDIFTYDHTGRMLKHTNKIDSNTEQLITYNQYDELGTATAKKVGGAYNAASSYANTQKLQEVNYSFNIRGWLKGINDVSDNLSTAEDLFAFKINYNTEDLAQSTPLYNGNIAETHWKTKKDNKLRSYSYNYDALNRLTDAKYDSVHPLETNNAELENYTEGAISYDKNGNIMHLERWGFKSVNNVDSIDKIDALTYTYFPYSNRLKSVSDTGGTEGFNNSTTLNADDYSYDANGNMKKDLNKNIGMALANEITYNYMNLPLKISFGTGTTNYIEYVYDAQGNKVQKKVKEGTTETITRYVGGLIYVTEGGVENLQYIAQGEGYIVPGTQILDSDSKKKYTTFEYVYQYKDHLGNIRLSYKKNGTGIEILEEDNYYAFGMKHKGYNIVATGSNVGQKFKYNGTEYEEALGLDMYEMAARQYDPTIARWVVIDPVIHHTMSPYNAFDNNPVYWADPSGADAQETNAGWEFDGVDAVRAFNAVLSMLDTGLGGFTVHGDLTFASGPGAPFLSMDMAALDFGMQYNGISIMNDLELASAIYKFMKGTDSGKFSYTIPTGYVEFDADGKRKKSIATAEVHEVPKGTVLVGHIHTHGADDGQEDTQRFSGAGVDSGDTYRNRINSKRYGPEYRAYVAVPNGSLWKYTPWTPGAKTVTGVFSTELPSDSKSTKRNKPFVSPVVVPQVLPTILSGENFTNKNLKTTY